MIIIVKKILLICTCISTMLNVKHEIDIFNYDEYMNKIWIPVEWKIYWSFRYGSDFVLHYEHR